MQTCSGPVPAVSVFVSSYVSQPCYIVKALLSSIPSDFYTLPGSSCKEFPEP